MLSGAGGALRPPAVSAVGGGRRRSGVDQSSGGEARERKQDVQGDERGVAGAAAAQRQQEGDECSRRHEKRNQEIFTFEIMSGVLSSQQIFKK